MGDRLFAELFCREIDHKADRAELLLAGILAYVRGVVPFVAQGSLQTLVEDAQARLTARISTKRVRVVSDCDRSLLHISLPDEQLRYVMDAALRMALALTPPGGLVQVRGTAPLFASAGEPGAPPAGSGTATVAFIVSEVWASPGPLHDGAVGALDVKSLGLAPEVLLLAEIARFHRGGFAVLPDPSGRGAVFSLTLPVAGQGDCVPG